MKKNDYVNEHLTFSKYNIGFQIKLYSCQYDNWSVCDIKSYYSHKRKLHCCVYKYDSGEINWHSLRRKKICIKLVAFWLFPWEVYKRIEHIF